MLKIADEFSRMPGPRLRIEGEHSGQEFLERLLLPAFDSARAAGVLLAIDLDGGYGFGSGFLDEAFGGLAQARKNACESLTWISDEEPYLILDIERYMSKRI